MIDLKQGDCLELMKDIPDGSVDMVLCDPPYGIDYQSRWKPKEQRFERMGKYSLDKDNQRIYRARKSEWKEKLAQVKESIQNFKKSVANSAESGIIEPKEYYAGIGDKLSGFKAKLKASVTPEKYKPVSTEYLSSLPKIKNIESMEQALKATNPNGYKNNCQRCVPAYEMRRRGYAVSYTHLTLPTILLV